MCIYVRANRDLPAQSPAPMIKKESVAGLVRSSYETKILFQKRCGRQFIIEEIDESFTRHIYTDTFENRCLPVYGGKMERWKKRDMPIRDEARKTSQHQRCRAEDKLAQPPGSNSISTDIPP